MAMRGPRHPIGAAPWTADERATALHIAQAEVDEFVFSAKNEMDWLNEHMADIFSENKINVADIFKTPGKLRGKTPRTARKGDMRAPLTDVFSATPKGAPNPFAVSKLSTLQQQQRRRSPSFKVAEDRSATRRLSSSPRGARPKTAAAPKGMAKTAKTTTVEQVPPSVVDSGYHGSQSQDGPADTDENKENEEIEEEDELAAGPATPERRPASRKAVAGGAMTLDIKQALKTMVPPVASPGGAASQTTQPTTDEASFHSAQEEQAAAVAPAAEMPTTTTRMATTTTTTRQVIFSSPTRSNDAGSSPFCPVRASTAAPHQLQKSSSPLKPAASVSPVRKPVPQPSSPLQSTTPACPPPRELLAAMDVGFPSTTAAVFSPALGHMHVPPAVPTPPTTAIPAFIAAQRAVDAAPKDGDDDDDDIVIAEDEEDEEDDVEVQMQLQQEEEEQQEQRQMDLAHSPSDRSSPARPVVRKSSINFASLPAREPFTSNKSMGGAGLSRISHIDPGRTSYYNRPTGGKSLGHNVRAGETEKDSRRSNDEQAAEDEGEHGMHGGERSTAQGMSPDAKDDAAAHSKTYAQRLHDRISMLGKSQANGLRPSKSLATHLPGATQQNPLSAWAQQQQPQQPQQQAQRLPQVQPTPKHAEQAQQPLSSPKRNDGTMAAPVGFPDEDDEQEEDDDWITPPPISATMSPRLNVAKGPTSVDATRKQFPTTAATGNDTEVVRPKESQQGVSRPASPIRKQLPPTVPERATSVVPERSGHSKSASVPSLSLADTAMTTATAKPVSVSNPTYSALAAVYETTDRPPTPSKSPARNYRDSPLKQVKNKLSSILKSSKGLLASSAAISAEGKSSLLMSPSSARLGLLVGPSAESLMSKARNDSNSDLARPDLSRQISASTTTSAASAASAAPTVSTFASQGARSLSKSPTRDGSPVRPIRKTRASTERERREVKQRDKEEKETQRLADQMEKLDKLREKEREKARVFSAEQARIAAAEKAERAERAERERAERAEREWAERERVERERAEKAERAERAEREEREHRERREQQELRERQQKQQRQQQQRADEEDAEMSSRTPVHRSPAKAQASSPARMPVKATRSSPRKAKAPQADTDVEMADAPTLPVSMLPPPPAHGAAAPTSATSSVPRSTQPGRTIRRPLKPTKEAPAKTRQAPTVIRVNTSSSQQQHQHQHQQSAQFHPSNSVLAANLHETLAGPPQAQHPSLKSKASSASLHTKPSLQSLKSSVSSTGRPKALELAAKRKEQEEREAQRKRDAKADIERKRAAVQEQEEQRRQEAKKQREREQAAAEAAAAKKAAAAQQRQAALDRAKQTRAPAAAVRTQLPSGPSTDSAPQQQQPARPASRLAAVTGSMVHRSQEELHRPVNAVLSNTGKALSKRALPGVDAHDGHGHGHGHSSRPGTAGGLGQAKRMRMSEEFDEDELEMGGNGNIPRASNIKGPPIRPSNGFKKDLNKSMFGNGYATAPASANVSRDLFKATVTTQHNHQARTGHPMDMAQVSKAAISFASHGNNAAASAAAAAAAAASTASSAAPANAHKTPLRPVGAALTSKSAAKSTGKVGAKSSPRVPNGDGIELPEIQTDDEDSEDEGQGNVAPWADSPDLRRALMRQETVDPFQVFGPPGPLNMEEVFHKSKDRWHKFRARTSSANWSGADRLTDEDIRKDLAARDKIRREGGWSYDLSRDLA